MSGPSISIDLNRERARLARRTVDQHGLSSPRNLSNDTLFTVSMAYGTSVSGAALGYAAIGATGVIAAGLGIVGVFLAVLYFGLGKLVQMQKENDAARVEKDREEKQQAKTKMFFESHRPAFDSKDPDRGGYDHVSPPAETGNRGIDSRNVA